MSGPEKVGEERVELAINPEVMPMLRSTLADPADVMANPARHAERMLCTCGLVQAGYYHTWAIRHAAACEAGGLFR